MLDKFAKVASAHFYSATEMMTACTIIFAFKDHASRKKMTRHICVGEESVKAFALMMYAIQQSAALVMMTVVVIKCVIQLQMMSLIRFVLKNPVSRKEAVVGLSLKSAGLMKNVLQDWFVNLEHV